MILADSSAWIEFLRATGSPSHLGLRDAFSADRPVATTGPVVMEVLIGARDERAADKLRGLFDRCELLGVEDPADYEAAAALYRVCRGHGTTIRGRIDCLIAVVAIRNHVPLLHCDSDFDIIARHTPLQVAGLR